MNTPKIFITLSTFAEYDAAPLDMLKDSGFQFRINPSRRRITASELFDLGRAATVLIAGVEIYDAEVFEQLPSLKCLSRCGAGVDNIDLVAARKRGIAVLNTPTVPTEAVAELTLTMVLALCRSLPRQIRHAHRREWTRLEAHLLSGKRVGLVGLGRIGRRVAELLAPFKTTICASDPSADSKWAEENGVTILPFADLIATSDVVSLHAAKSVQQPLLIGRAEFGVMKRGALFLNLARGGLVDLEALYDALKSGHLGGAGLDVYPEEPYQGPLCELENVVLTPHSATLTVETRVAMEVECVDKAIRFLRGEIRPGEGVV